MITLLSDGFSFKIGRISYEGNKQVLGIGHVQHPVFAGLLSGVSSVMVEKVEKDKDNFKPYDVLKTLDHWNVIKVAHIEENQCFRYIDATHNHQSRAFIYIY